MSDRPLSLMLIDPDPIFTVGFQTLCQRVTNLQIVAQAREESEAWRMLTLASGVVDLIVLDLAIEQYPGQICQPLKSQYPRIPILLLTQELSAEQVAMAQRLQLEGYCPKKLDFEAITAMMGRIASGEQVWEKSTFPPVQATQRHWRSRGLEQIETAIASVRLELENPALSVLDRAIVAGRLRELLAARWMVSRLLPIQPIIIESNPRITPRQIPKNSALVRQDSASDLRRVESRELPKISSRFEIIYQQLQGSLKNLTSIPLEIDILQEDQKRDLSVTILQVLDDLLQDWQRADRDRFELTAKTSAILEDLWADSTRRFFGKYTQISPANQVLIQQEIVPALLSDSASVKISLLDKIPLVPELLDYLLYRTPLFVDSVAYSPDTPEAESRSQLLLQNLILQIANAVFQPFLNKFADIEDIKQRFYNRELMSTREIERFRNELSWKYRQRGLWLEPKAIFESQYQLLALDPRGIKQVTIYASRKRELEQLQGIPLAVTLMLELRDAIAPRIRSLIAFVGQGLVYILTQVIGRAIGLIGRGVLQGLGSTWTDSRYPKSNFRSDKQ